MRERSAAAPATAAEVARALGLAPHPEGGYFRETYRSPVMVDTDRGRRALSTAVTFLVAGDSPSRFHRLASDELWVYQAGDPLELLTLSSEEALQRVLLGDPLSRVAASGGSATVTTACVPAGTWQAARVATGHSRETDGGDSWTLVSCVVTPGFEYGDFELAGRAALVTAFPVHEELIVALT